MSKFDGVQFLVNREVKDRILEMREAQLSENADSNCDKCYGLGRSAYKIVDGKRKVIVCKCVIRNIKRMVQSDEGEGCQG